VSFLEGLRTVISETPLGWVLVAGGAVAMVVSLVVAYEARGRRKLCQRLADALQAGAAGADMPRFSPLLELAGGAALALVPALTVLVVSLSRAVLLDGLTMAEPEQRATALATGIYGQLNGLAMGCNLTLLVSPVAAVGLGMALTARLNLRALGEAAARPPQIKGYVIPVLGVLFVVLAMGPLLSGVGTWVTDLIRSFASVAGVAPDQKVELILMGMDEARPGLLRGAKLSGGGLLVVLCLAAVAVWRSPLASGRPRKGYWAALAGALGLACLATWFVVPYWQENQSPIPVSPTSGASAWEKPGAELPALQGPDPAVRAPILTLTARGMLLDGAPMERPKQLAESLEVMRHNWRLLNPDREFPGLLTLHADRDLDAEALQAPLASAMAAGYRQVQLGFIREATLRRPVLGEVPLSHQTAALIHLHPGEPSPGGTYGTLALAAVKARQAGKNVAFTVKAPAAPPAKK